MNVSCIVISLIRPVSVLNQNSVPEQKRAKQNWCCLQTWKRSDEVRCSLKYKFSLKTKVAPSQGLGPCRCEWQRFLVPGVRASSLLLPLLRGLLIAIWCAFCSGCLNIDWANQYLDIGNLQFLSKNIWWNVLDSGTYKSKTPWLEIIFKGKNWVFSFFANAASHLLEECGISEIALFLRT